jgi:hypothetical protein
VHPLFHAAPSEAALAPTLELVIAVPLHLLIGYLLFPLSGRAVAHPGPVRALAALAVAVATVAALVWIAART